MLDRAELAGTGVAVTFHVALIAALSMSLAQVDDIPEPPSMEVELVDEVGLTASAPTSIATPPPAAQAPEIAPVPDPVPQPMPDLVRPAPRIEPKPAPRAITPAKAPPQRVTPPRPQPRASRLGDDFLKGIPNSPSKSTAPAKAAAATFSATAKASVGSLLLQQAKPCADNQPFLGEGANKVRLRVTLHFARNGRLAAAPRVEAVGGDSDLRAKYGDLLEDQVRRIFTQCAPFRLPAELYETPTGGWKTFPFNYRVE